MVQQLTTYLRSVDLESQFQSATIRVLLWPETILLENMVVAFIHVPVFL